MNKKFKDIILNPGKFFRELNEVISWPKVIGFLLIVVFFANLGIFIYDKNNPVDTNFYTPELVQSPFSEDNNAPNSPFHREIVGSKGGNPVHSSPDTKGVFDRKKVNENNLSPIAKIDVITTGLTEGFFAGDTIFLSATDSYDPDGSIAEYRWSFDESKGLSVDATGQNTTVRYNNEGVYTVTLMVIDNEGAEATTSMIITVQPKPQTKPNTILPLETTMIDFDDLAFRSRLEVQNSISSSLAEFQANASSALAQAIHQSQQRRLPPLPSLNSADLVVGRDPSSVPPVVDTVGPKDGLTIYHKKPTISAGYYGNNEIDIDGVEMTVNGVPVTQDAMVTRLGINYTPSEDLEYGEHHVMLVIPDKMGLRTVKSWSFTIEDPAEKNADKVPTYEDTEGPRILMYYPAENARQVKPDSDIRVTYNKPVQPESVEVAVVNLSTHITKFFTGSQIEWNATHTGFVIRPDENIFNYGNGYQIISKQKDELGNESVYEWFVKGEEYNAPKFEITSPTNNSTVNTPQVTVTGFADPTYKIFVDDVVAFVDAKGAFKAEIDLEQGKNEILIVAKDLQGKESSQYLILTYDPSANEANPILAPTDSPVIVDASIKDGEVITQVRPIISFVFADTNGIDRDSIVLKVDGEDVTTFSFISRDTITYQPLRPLSQGEHEVQVIASNNKGKTTDYTMTFTIDAYPEQPTNLTATLTNNNKSVLLLWDGVDNIPNPEYRVYRGISPNVELSAANEVKRGLTTTSWTDDNVIDKTTYYYVVAAVNKDGNLSLPSNEVSIRVNSVPPLLQIFSPEKNFVSSEDTVTIEGITDVNEAEIVEIYVNFELQATPDINTDGTFEAVLDLIEGDNVITTIARDAEGNEAIDVRTIKYVVPDTTPPEVVSVNPKGVNVAIDSKVVVQYNEEIDPTTFKMEIRKVGDHGVVTPITITDVGLLVSDDKTTFTYTKVEGFEFETNYRVHVRASDVAGNETQYEWEFRTDRKNPPVLTVLTPEEGFITDKEHIFVSGNTEPNVEVAISVNGVLQIPKTEAQGNGYFKHLITLEPGANTIVVVATDHLGYATTKTVKGVYDAPDLEAPYLLIDGPAQNAVVGTDTINVSGSTEPGATVTISVNGKDQGKVGTGSNGQFHHPVKLYQGANLITIIATDDAGNQTVETRSVRFDNQGPSLAIINPIDGFTTNQTSIEVRGFTDRSDSTVSISVNGKNYHVSVLEDGSFNRMVDLDRYNNSIRITAEDIYGNRTTEIVTVYSEPTQGVTGGIQGLSGGMTSGFAQSQDDNKEPQGFFSLMGGTTDVIDPQNGDMRWTGGDHTAPTLQVYFSENSPTNRANVVLSGVTEPKANVVIHQSATHIYEGKANVNNGSFSTPVTLREGQNLFTVTSTDVAGNKVMRTVSIMLISEGPSLNILTPRKDQIFNTQNIMVSGITKAKAQVEIRVGQADARTLNADEFGYFEVNAPVRFDGRQDVVITVTDELGNKTTKSVTVNIDRTEPTLSLHKINDHDITQLYRDFPDGLLLTTRATTGIITGRTEPNILVKVVSNGRTVGSGNSDNDGNFMLDISFASGVVSKIKVIATDKAGNESVRYVRVKADTEAPIVQIYTPNSSKSLGSGSVVVSGLVTDDSPTTVIRIGLNNNMNRATANVYDTVGTFSATVSGLVEGANVIHIRAEDALGNQSYQRVTVVYSSRHDKALAVIDTDIEPSDVYTDFDDAIQKALDYLSTAGPYGKYNKPKADAVNASMMKTLQELVGDMIYGGGTGYELIFEAKPQLDYWVSILAELIGDPQAFAQDMQQRYTTTDPITVSVSLQRTYNLDTTPNPPNQIQFSASSYPVTFSGHNTDPSNVNCSLTNTYNIQTSGLGTPSYSGGQWTVRLKGTPLVGYFGSSGVTDDNKVTYTYEGSFTVRCTITNN